MKNNISILVYIFFFTITLSACNDIEEDKAKTKPTEKISTNKDNSTPKENAVPSLQTELQDLESEIDKIIGSANCSNSNQCGSLAMGNKACGGPKTYIAYSTKNTDTTVLQSLSEQHQEKSKILNKLTNAVSDCMMVLQPTFICRSGKCQK